MPLRGDVLQLALVVLLEHLLHFGRQSHELGAAFERGLSRHLVKVGDPGPFVMGRGAAPDGVNLLQAHGLDVPGAIAGLHRAVEEQRLAGILPLDDRRARANRYP